MPCFKPLQAWRAAEVNSSGKRGIVFDPKLAFVDMPVTLPCGQCIGCRLERSRQWAVRMMHEASLHERNCFLTLTYDDAHLPSDWSLNVDHFQRFMKRYRKMFGPVRFFHCGEYGEENFRPHYHACIFGHDFSDRLLFRRASGASLYVSESLSKLWPYGFSTVGDLTFESAAYVARYVTKKVTGEQSERHYSRVLESTGECVQVLPEYCTMSRRPGIGSGWYDKYHSEVFPLDRVVVRGRECKPPRFYDARFSEEFPEAFEKIKLDRKFDAEARMYDNDWRRLLERETHAVLKQKTFSGRNSF